MIESCIQAQIDILFTFKLYANSACENVTITEITISGPIGLNYDATVQDPVNSSIAYSTIYWKPESNQIGYHTVCAVATDSNFISSKFSCMIIHVYDVPMPDPYIVQGSMYPTGVLTSTFLTGIDRYMTFRVMFNVAVTKPQNITSITIYNSSDYEYLKFDCSSSVFVYYSYNTLTFYIPVGSFGIGSYYVLFDEGVGVGKGDCMQLTPKIDSKEFWEFIVTNQTHETNQTKIVTYCSLFDFITTLFLIGAASSFAHFLILVISFTYFTSSIKNRKKKSKNKVYILSE